MCRAVEQWEHFNEHDNVLALRQFRLFIANTSSSRFTRNGAESVGLYSLRYRIEYTYTVLCSKVS